MRRPSFNKVLTFLAVTAKLADSITVLQNISTIRTAIPPDFSLQIGYHDKPVNIIRFYDNSIRALVYESAFTFTDSTQGYYGHSDVFDFLVIPSESTYPHLQHCHIVWAIQRLAETLYKNKEYKELLANIYVQGFRGSDSVRVGSLTSRSLITDTLNTNENVDLDSSSSLTNTTAPLLPPNDTAAALGPLLASLSPSAKTMQIEIHLAPSPQKLHSTSVFLTIIRLLSRLASLNNNDAASAFGYGNTDTRVCIELQINAPRKKEPAIVNAHVVQALLAMVRAMVQERRFEELDAMFWETMQGGKGREVFGVLMLRRLERCSQGEGWESA